MSYRLEQEPGEGANSPERLPVIQVRWNEPFPLHPLPVLPAEIALNGKLPEHKLMHLGSYLEVARYQLAIAGVPKDPHSSDKDYAGETEGELWIAASLSAGKDFYRSMQGSTPSSSPEVVEIAGLPEVHLAPRYLSQDYTEVEIVATSLPLVMGGEIAKKGYPSNMDSMNLLIIDIATGKWIKNNPLRGKYSQYILDEKGWTDPKRSGANPIFYLPYMTAIFTDLQFILGDLNSPPPELLKLEKVAIHFGTLKLN